MGLGWGRRYGVRVGATLWGYSGGDVMELVWGRRYGVRVGATLWG